MIPPHGSIEEAQRHTTQNVDISPLNKHCKRETFPTESPFHLARRGRKDSDAWNSYHSVLLCQSDHHLITFITPFGRWRLKASFPRVTATRAASMRYYLTLSERNDVSMTPSTITPTHRRTGGEPLILSSVYATQESSSTQINYISGKKLSPSQGSAYVTKPSSLCQNTWTPSATVRRQHLPRTFAAGLAL